MKIICRYFLLAAIAGALLPQGTEAQVANNNPTGPAGDYNSLVTTAGSYDPLTGSASREICDISVAGAVGSYPLKWSRRMSTRAITRPATFGHGGGWSHSYQWELEINHPALPTPTPPNWPPDERPDGVLKYADGRSVDLDTPWSDLEPIPAAEEGPYGMMDRFIDRHGGDYDLLLTDGGVVKFHKLVQDPQHPHCQARAIVDPYGLVTTLHYDSQGRLDRITEPGQSHPRYLEIHYGPHQWHLPAGVATIDLIDRVEANDGFGHVTQSVNYVYEEKSFNGKTFLYLTGANYNGGDTASYDYQPSNRLPLNNHDFEGSYAGLIRTCADDRFAGPMKRIMYELRPRTAYYGAAYGEIWQEKNAFGQALSELEIPSPPIPGHPCARREHRGNAVRTFYYDNSVWLSDRSDFLNPPNWTHSTIEFISTSQNICHFEDANHHTTHKLREGDFQATSRVTYAQTPFDNEQPYVETLYEDPAHHYVQFHRDERHKETEYVRDSNNHMVLRINHPSGGGFETFTYNAFGQVLDHRMTNGGVEHFTYDSRGLKLTHTPPITDSDPPEGPNPTRYFYYGESNELAGYDPENAEWELDHAGEERPDLNDRLKRVIDPRGNSTWFIYNQRGQVTQVTRTGGTTTKSGYKSDGTLLWTQDELGHTTNYTCDEYKRVTEVKKIVDGVEEKVTNDYTPRNGLDRFSHTTSSIYSVQSLYMKVDHDYDENFRRSWTTAAPGAPPTKFNYDPAGNLDSVEDPRHKFTHFGYDQRNRQTSSLNDELNQSVEVEYDPAGNKTKETRHEEGGLAVFHSWDYDDMNRLWHAYDWRTNPTATANQTTTYQRDDAGNTLFITDTKGAVYGFEYDKLNRKTKAKYPTAYPSPSPSETWHYDAAGNVDIYTNPSNQVRNFHYDNRNRQDHSSWDGGASVGPDIVTHYDNASRVTSVVTKNGQTPITIVAFGYDEANRQIWEDQTFVQPDGSVISHRVKSLLDHDGRRTNLQITDPPQMGANLTVSSQMSGSGSFSISYDYNSRNQLWHITGDYGENWHFTYGYDDSGNMTSRQADYNGNTNITGCASGPNNGYDALNRPRTWEQTGPDGFHTLSQYRYDKANREEATWREEDGIGERFTYEFTNQLATASYGGHVANGPPNDASRTVTYAYTADKLNRSSKTEVGGPSAGVTNYSPNGLNQYTSTPGHSYAYDSNFNLALTQGFNGVYDAANHLVSASNGGSLENVPAIVDFVYDGLGRCVKRTLTVGASSEATMFVFDGWKPIGEFDQWNNFQAWNVYGSGADEILLRQKGAIGYTVFLLDRHGNVAFLVNNDGVVLENYTYDVFGQPTITITESGEKLSSTWYHHDFLFQGREYISQLGIYDYRNRFYLPATGRFLQTDPKGFNAGDMNLFRYCGDDPIDGSDPLGLDYQLSQDPHNASHYIITLPIVWRGGTSEQKRIATRGIETRWSTAYKNARFDVRVVDGLTVPQEQRNFVTIHQGSGVSDAKGRVANLYAGDRLEATAAHEAGHLMGFPDRYKWAWVHGFKEVEYTNGNPTPQKGYWDFDIMVNPNGVPTQDHFRALLKGDGKGYMGESPSGRRAAPAHGQLSVLCNTGGGGWATEGYFPGGGEAGEGFHPVTPNKN